jgi:CheY-like chemotaxis protein
MPKMNGKEAFDEISRVRPEIKVIFSSGYAPETIRQKAALTDGANLITKPVSPTELLRKVRLVLDGKLQVTGGVHGRASTDPINYSGRR